MGYGGFRPDSGQVVGSPGDGGIDGVIYLDNQMKTYPFEVADLHILGAIANQVAIRIKQEELFNRLKQEEITRSNMERFFSPDIAEILSGASA